MLKRKADHDTDENQGAKKPRTEGAAAAEANATDQSECFESALTGALLAHRIATQTLNLVDAIKAIQGSYMQRMQTVVNELKADAARPASLLDLSLVPEGDEVGQDRYAGRVW